MMKFLLQQSWIEGHCWRLTPGLHQCQAHDPPLSCTFSPRAEIWTLCSSSLLHSMCCGATLHLSSCSSKTAWLGRRGHLLRCLRAAFLLQLWHVHSNLGILLRCRFWFSRCAGDSTLLKLRTGTAVHGLKDPGAQPQTLGPRLTGLKIQNLLQWGWK